ncbi:MAG TPA: BON domain-containing protein [Casimicrobiaceae bacterium]|nr:BON domain-containing protein [Casimicrobiaceae bacterium]
MRARSPGIAVLASWLAMLPATASAEELVQLDPFAQATKGHPNCPAPSPPLMTREQVERSAHARAERGTRCAMEGTCEPGGAYRRDPEINESVRAAIALEARFRDTSTWLTTSRGWVTLQGCVRDAAQRLELEEFVRNLPRVVRVFNETRSVPVRVPRPRRPVP